MALKRSREEALGSIEDEGNPDPVMTLKEILDQEEKLEETTHAVLGASDPQNCSYDKGYVKRQALYACLTCHPKSYPGFQPGAICLACSYNCHDGHDLVELYTKRNYRCDCGNKKFSFNPCRLQPTKDDYNEKNVYNQNFKGLYCTCSRPYPEEEGSSETSDDAMMQCVICEDWFHEQHSGASGLDDVEDDSTVELICGSCLPKLDFLKFYSEHTLKVKASQDGTEIEEAKSMTTSTTVENESTNINTSKPDETAAQPHSLESESANSMKVELETGCNGTVSEIVPEAKEPKTDESKPAVASTVKTLTVNETVDCKLLSLRDKEVKPFTGGAFWLKDWRNQLCRCEDCVKMYESSNVAFLIDENDSIDKYESEGKEKMKSAAEESETELGNMIDSMDRVGKIEFVSGVVDFKSELKTFLQGFASSGRLVTEKDMKDFFSQLHERKRRRMETTPSHYCG